MPGSEAEARAAVGSRIGCRLCGGTLRTRPVFRIDHAPRSAQGFVTPSTAAEDTPIVLDIRECADCGLVQSCSPPVPMWQHVVRSNAYSAAMEEVRRRQLDHFRSVYGLRGRRVLEAGCASGDLLGLVTDAGMQPFGLEAGPGAALAGEAGLPVQTGYPSRGVRLEGGPFDAFVSLNVLEHAVDPRDFLRGVRENLSSDAVGMLEVPSFERMQEQDRYYDFIADHLSYFTAKTLRTTLEMSGFEVLDLSREWWTDDLVTFVRVAASAYDPRASERVTATVDRVRAFLDSEGSDGRVVAVWGASHQALTLLCLAGVERVSYVIDSAPFKQGLLTPATHVPVVGPEHLRTRPPGAVLVMAAGYSDEVVRVLTRDWGFMGVVGVLRADRVDLVQGS
jgi:hypothetical protein